MKQTEVNVKRKRMAEKIINQIESRQSTDKRAIETRKKILLGAMLEEWVSVATHNTKRLRPH